jgi:hypothetical protein
VRRGRNEQSANSTRPTGLIGLLKVMMKNVKLAPYVFFFLFKYLFTFSLVFFPVCHNETSSKESSINSETHQGSSLHSGPLFTYTFSRQRSTHVEICLTFSRRSSTQVHLSVIFSPPRSWHVSFLFSGTQSCRVSSIQYSTTRPENVQFSLQVSFTLPFSTGHR